jgi:hypothetical protein
MPFPASMSHEPPALALLHPVGKTGILHPMQGGEFHAGKSTALERIKQGFPLGQRSAHPPKAIGLQDN